jgi:phenylacetate-CoA ligase
MLSLQWQLERSQWWSPEALREQQFTQIRALAAHAARNVPWYENALRQAGLQRAEQIDPDSFARWPILAKRQVRPNEAQLRARQVPKEHGTLSETYTTGSTGEPLRIYHTEVASFFAHALVIRDHLLHERDFSCKFAVIRADLKRGAQPGWGLANAVFSTGPGCSESSATSVGEQLDWLVKEKPGYLLSRAANLRALLEQSRATGKIPKDLREIIAYGDMPPPDLVTLARELWNVRAVAAYSCQELGTIASQCPGHAHYLVHAETVYLEILRPDGAACSPGEVGRVVVTPLHNFAMPLIRYELGDYAEVGDSCPTGRGLPTLARIVGRYRNMLRDPTGAVRWPTFPGELWLSIAPFQKIRLLQHTLSRIEIEFEMPRDLTEEECARLTAALHAKLGYPFELQFSRVLEIERAPGGKFEDFVSLLPADSP